MKKIIVISAINLRSGGTLSVLNDCLKYLTQNKAENYNIVALVHKKKVIEPIENIEFLEFPNSAASYLYRLYYEYFYFWKLSKQLKPYLWLSLHDMTPNVKAEIQAVYCHNPTPFYKLSFREVFVDFKFFFFVKLYKYIYKINIQKNRYVIVQQKWIRDQFKKRFHIKNCVVSYPKIGMTNIDITENKENNGKKLFFFPAFPRVFKNFELICKAVLNVDEKYKNKFEVILTISGTENRYSKYLYNTYGHNKNIKFIGQQSREEVFNLYRQVDCLIFPSKLETWGLPITEFKAFNKPILLADMSYAHETIGEYDKVKFFDPNNHYELTGFIERFLDNSLEYDTVHFRKPAEPFCKDWEELFMLLLKE